MSFRSLSEDTSAAAAVRMADASTSPTKKKFSHHKRHGGSARKLEGEEAGKLRAYKLKAQI